MSQSSWYALNQRLNSLASRVANIPAPPIPPDAYATLASNQTFTGLNTFVQLPQSSAVPTVGADLVNKTYADSLTPAVQDITQVLTVGNNALDVSQIFSSVFTTITNQITDTDIIINDSVTGINSLLENNILSITDNTGGVNDNSYMDYEGVHQIHQDPLTSNNTMNTTYNNIVVSRVDNTTGLLETASADFTDGMSYRTDNTVLSMKSSQTEGVIKCFDLPFSTPFPIDIQASALTLNGVPILSAIPSWSDTLTVSSNANQNINLNGFNIGTVNDIVLNTINGNPYPVAIPSWNDTLNVNPNATQSINLSGNDINGVNNIVLNTINGLPPSGSPNLQQVLTVGQSAGNQNISDVNLIQMQDAQTYLTSASLYFGNNNGSITGLQNVNGLPYPPSYSADTLTQVLTAGNNASGLNMGGVGDIALSTINGNPYPPFPVAPYGLNGVLGISNDALGLSMTGIDNINLTTINNSSYPPSYSTPDLNNVLNQGNSAYHDIDMTTSNIINCGDLGVSTINGSFYTVAKRSYTFTPYGTGTIGAGTPYFSGTTVNILAGTYSITWSIQFDGSMTYGGSGNPPPYMVKGYCYLHGTTYGDYTTTNTNNGYNPSTYISNDNAYPNFITMTDTIVLGNTDDYYLGGFFNSNAVGSAGMWLFATMVLQ